jgi:hypothetical protein
VRLATKEAGEGSKSSFVMNTEGTSVEKAIEDSLIFF